jgi:hypothetical protein
VSNEATSKQLSASGHASSGEIVDRLNLRCRCGRLSWDLIDAVPPRGVRYICHCDDCQAFAAFTSHAAEILDAHGGTDAYQLPSSQIEILHGAEHLACAKVTSRPLLRWYCHACRTPVANTYHTSRLSFVSVPLCGARPDDRDAFCGPPAGHIWTKFGWGDLSGVRRYSIPAMLWRMLSRIVLARLTGAYRQNPFFSPDGAPIAVPLFLSHDERSALDVSVRRGA